MHNHFVNVKASKETKNTGTIRGLRTRLFWVSHFKIAADPASFFRQLYSCDKFLFLF